MCGLRAILPSLLEDLVLDKRSCLFRAELTTTRHTVKADFAIKMDFSTATSRTDYILILRLEHFPFKPLFRWNVALIPHALSAINEENMSEPGCRGSQPYPQRLRLPLLNQKEWLQGKGRIVRGVDCSEDWRF